METEFTLFGEKKFLIRQFAEYLLCYCSEYFIFLQLVGCFPSVSFVQKKKKNVADLQEDEELAIVVILFSISASKLFCQKYFCNFLEMLYLHY